jgi:hypothetical protein
MGIDATNKIAPETNRNWGQGYLPSGPLTAPAAHVSAQREGFFFSIGYFHFVLGSGFAKTTGVSCCPCCLM